MAEIVFRKPRIERDEISVEEIMQINAIIIGNCIEKKMNVVAIF